MYYIIILAVAFVHARRMGWRRRVCLYSNVPAEYFFPTVLRTPTSAFTLIIIYNSLLRSAMTEFFDYNIKRKRLCTTTQRRADCGTTNRARLVPRIVRRQISCTQRRNSRLDPQNDPNFNCKCTFKLFNVYTCTIIIFYDSRRRTPEI